MTEITIAIAAVSAGASLFAQGLLGEGGREAYQALKTHLLGLVAPGDLARLEQQPDSAARQAVLVEELGRALPAGDLTLHRLAAALADELAAIAPPDPATGVLLERVKAANLRLKEIAASGTGVAVRDGEFTGDIDISGVRAGVTPGNR